MTTINILVYLSRPIHNFILMASYYSSVWIYHTYGTSKTLGSFLSFTIIKRGGINTLIKKNSIIKCIIYYNQMTTKYWPTKSVVSN